MSENNLIIDFNKNYNNKLNCDSFLTMRIHKPQKYIIGRSYKIRLNGYVKGTATLRNKRTIRVNQIDSFIAYIDVGCSVKDAINKLKEIYEGMTNNTLIDLCLLTYDSKPKQPKQRKLEL